MEEGRIHTEMLGDAHAYTRSEVPWSVSAHKLTAYEKMIRYLSGGGMRTFGRTIRQEETRRRQRRFLAVSAVLATIWLLLLVL